jgi:cytochrome c-type biogenesis protein CcmH/NrfG
MMAKLAVYGVVFALSVASPAFAKPVDNYADQIASLTQLVSVSPRDGGVYAELAGAYVRAGRLTDAMTAYRRVLALDNVMLETRTGDAVWSHEVARKALATTEALTSL